MDMTRLASGLRRLRPLVGRVWSLLKWRSRSKTAGSVHLAPAGQPPLVLAPVSHRYLRRPVLVASDLRTLRGPAAGIVTLPLSLQWSGMDNAARFDLDDHRQRPSLYATVLREAGEPSDLETWLNGDLLVEVWPRLVLPKAVRAAWEEQHQVLFEAGTGRRLRAAS